MADLHFVDFASMPGPVRKIKISNIRATGRLFQNKCYYSLTDEPSRVWFCRAEVFAISQQGPLFGDSQNLLDDEREARHFNISTLKGSQRKKLKAFDRIKTIILLTKYVKLACSSRSCLRHWAESKIKSVSSGTPLYHPISYADRPQTSGY